MFAVHVSHLLAAYYQQALPPAQARRVERHVQRCARCREEAERIRAAHHALAGLPLCPAPETLWNRIEARLPAVKDLRPTAQWQPCTGLEWRTRRLALAIAGLSFVLALFLLTRSQWIGPAWQVRRLAGDPVVGWFPMGSTGRLHVGQWLTTDGKSRAEIAVADIGQVTVAPRSRVRLLETGRSEHRLELAEGALDARVTAPPRLFIVATRAAQAVDLGCAYHLQVDRQGVTWLHVTVGMVALEGSRYGALVVAGASCETRPGRGQGTPVRDDAPEILKAALHQFDFENGGAPAVEKALAAARPQDALSLWHLLAAVSEPERSAVYDRLAALSPPPPGVGRAGILHLDPAMLEIWKQDLITRHLTAPYFLGNPF